MAASEFSSSDNNRKCQIVVETNVVYVRSHLSFTRRIRLSHESKVEHINRSSPPSPNVYSVRGALALVARRKQF